MITAGSVIRGTDSFCSLESAVMSNYITANIKEDKNIEDHIAADVTISKEGMKLLNDNVTNKNPDATRKKKLEMVIDERILIEPRLPRTLVPLKDWNEMMRIDEPETFAKMQEYNYKAGNLLSGEWSLDSNDMIPDNIKNEYQELKSKAWDIRYDWFSRKCMTDKASVLVNPVEKQYAVIDSMESKYQDTSFNVYSDTYANIEGIIDRHSGMWRFSTKFNIQVSNEMLNKMTSDPDSEETKKYMDQIDKAVDAMKNMASKYDGPDEYLRFGVKLRDDGSVTYRANIFSETNKNGLVTDTPEDLLMLIKMLERTD